MRPRVWFNADLESRNYIVPGLIAVIMMVIAALLTSLTVAREWERGTMEQLISTPVTGAELILGKLLPYFCIGMFDVLLAVLMGEFLFHVPLRGSVGVAVRHGGDLPGRRAGDGHADQHRRPRANCWPASWRWSLTFLPSFLLSGFMFTIANMPRPIQMVTYLVPARYFVVLLKGIYLKGVGLEILAGDAVLLVVFGVVMVAVAKVKFKKKLTCESASENGDDHAIMFERIHHMLIKEFIQVFRDPRMRTVIFVIPCVQVLVIGYAVTTDVQHVPTAVYDLDNSTASRELTARFVRSGYFDVVAYIARRARRPGS